jgi:catechol-2,3-dioxygenase
MMTSSTNDNLSIGPSSLRTLLQTASQSLLQNEKHGLDLNGIVWMEHLNLVVGSMDAAREFYVEFLGCTVDENEKHFNLGQQQVGLISYAMI